MRYNGERKSVKCRKQREEIPAPPFPACFLWEDTMPKKKSKKALKAQRARARRRRTIKTTVETAALLVVLLVLSLIHI